MNKADPNNVIGEGVIKKETAYKIGATLISVLKD